MKKNKNQKVTPELGADKDGMKQGGVVIESTNPFEFKFRRKMATFCLWFLHSYFSWLVYGAYVLFFYAIIILIYIQLLLSFLNHRH